MTRGPYGARPIPELTPDQVARFWSRVVKTPGCWVWTGGTTGHPTHRYGQMRLGSGMYVAHRIAYTLAHGSIPDGAVVDHLCGVTLCVNPDHMEPVTQRDNVLRGDSPIAHNVRNAS